MSNPLQGSSLKAGDAGGEISEERVRQVVRRVVYRLLGRAAASPQRPLVAERDLLSVPNGGSLELPAGALVTPLARQLAFERRIELRSQLGPRGSSGGQPVAVGADHGGFRLKASLIRSLTEWGYPVLDCGTQDERSVDYPDYALAVAQLVASGQAWRGVMVDGAGIGSCMAANKVPGVRAALCYDQATALNSREHNDANLLTLGAGQIGEQLAVTVLRTFLSTAFGGGRHARRVDKIAEIERRYLRQAVAAR